MLPNEWHTHFMAINWQFTSLIPKAVLSITLKPVHCPFSMRVSPFYFAWHFIYNLLWNLYHSFRAADEKITLLYILPLKQNSYNFLIEKNSLETVGHANNTHSIFHQNKSFRLIDWNFLSKTNLSHLKLNLEWTCKIIIFISLCTPN